jgi:hypothetical protein
LVNEALENKRQLLNSIATEAAIQVEAYRVQAEAEFQKNLSAVSKLICDLTPL